MKEDQQGELTKSNITTVLYNIIQEKKIEYKSTNNIKINFNINSDNYYCFSEINISEFKRIISNLINNSIEALLKKEKGKIDVILSKSSKDVLISITDNGIGIKQEVLDQVFNKGFSHGKENLKNSGSGLGLYYTQNKVREWNGSLNILSTEKEGTTIELRLPLTKMGDKLLSKLSINNNIAIVDDDISIHEVWDQRIKKLEKNISIFHYFNLEEINLDHDFFLIDYSFDINSSNGIDFIVKNNLQDRSVLVTSQDEDQEIQNKIKKYSIKYIPKSISGFIPIQ